MVRRSRLRSVGLPVLALGCAVGAILLNLESGAPARALRPTPRVSVSGPHGYSAGHNRQAARRDAARLLASLRLERGARRLQAEPGGDGGWLKPIGELVGDSARYDAHGWWRVKAPPSAVLAYIRAHPPPGSRLTETGSGGNTRTGSRSSTVGYTWPEVAGVLGVRELQVTVTAPSGSVTGVLAESQSDWVVPRPSSERIPGSVREIDIIAGKPGRSPYVVHVTTGSDVRHMVGLFNSMPIVQPVTINCPALLGGGQVLTFTFRDRGGGPSLAEASFTEFPNLGAWSGPCTPVELRIGGRRQQPLAGGHFITHVDQILGISLKPGR